MCSLWKGRMPSVTVKVAKGWSGLSHCPILFVEVGQRQLSMIQQWRVDWKILALTYSEVTDQWLRWTDPLPHAVCCGERKQNVCLYLVKSMAIVRSPSASLADYHNSRAEDEEANHERKSQVFKAFLNCNSLSRALIATGKEFHNLGVR